MNAQAELATNLFETKFRVQIQEMKIKPEMDGDAQTRNCNFKLRVDSRDFDDVMKFLLPTQTLKNHNLPSREDFEQAIMDVFKNKNTYDREYKDHQAKFYGSGRNMGSFGNVQLTTFQFEPKHTNLYFHLLCKAVGADDCQKLIDCVGSTLQLDVKRAAHWSEQQGLELGEDGMPDPGDADKQTDLTDEQKKTIERNKEKANKTNTNKARNRK